MHTDTLQLIDEWGPEKVVYVSDRRSGMRGVLVIDNSARGVGKGRRGPVPRRCEGRDHR
jgi:glutamate dehydrogenase (NAD(P)+)